MNDPVDGIRARNRAGIQAALLDAAREQLAERGAAGLSVRAVARQLGLVPSALFRYIANRDELLTLLIVQAYEDLADDVEAALVGIDTTDYARRWRTLAHEVRRWALTHPHEYALIFGTPVPRYQAPPGRTNPAGTRVTTMLAQIGADAAAAGHPAAEPCTGTPAAADLATAATCGIHTDPDFARHDRQHSLSAVWLANGITAWVLLTGAISAELFEQLGTDFGDPDALFEYVVGVAQMVLLGPAATPSQDSATASPEPG